MKGAGIVAVFRSSDDRSADHWDSSGGLDARRRITGWRGRCHRSFGRTGRAFERHLRTRAARSGRRVDRSGERGDFDPDGPAGGGGTDSLRNVFLNMAESAWKNNASIHSLDNVRALVRATVDLRDAVVVVRPGVLPNAEKTAATVLVEEVEKRTGLRLNTSSTWPADRPVIAITSVGSSVTKAEGYHLFVDQSKAQAAVRIMGADARGTLFGVGNFCGSRILPKVASVSIHRSISLPRRRPDSRAPVGYRRRRTPTTLGRRSI